MPVGAVDDNSDIGTTGVTRLGFGGVAFERSSKLASLERRRRGPATEVGWTVGEGGVSSEASGNPIQHWRNTQNLLFFRAKMLNTSN